MSALNTDVITTKTVYRTPLEFAPNALPPDQYVDAFLKVQAETVRSFQSGKPQLPAEVLENQATARRYFGVWQMNHSFFAKMFPSYLMNVAAKCPYQDVRREILKDCNDEEVSDPDANGLCHIEVLYHDAALFGISREEVEAFEPTAILLTCIHAIDNLTRILSWEGGYAAVGGLEAIRVAVARGYISREEFSGPWAGGAKTVEELCGLPKGSLMNAPLHQAKDQIHGGGVLNILSKYATTREIQEMTFWAIKTARSTRMITGAEQTRLARQAIGLSSDALLVTGCHGQ